MKSKRLWAVLAAAAVAAAGAGASTVLATPQAGLTTTTVATASVPPLQIRSDYRPQPQTWPPSFWSAMLRTHGITDLYVVDNVIAPGGTTGWHTHSGPSLIIVKSGTVTNYRAETRGCAGVDYPAGTAFVDCRRQRHPRAQEQHRRARGDGRRAAHPARSAEEDRPPAVPPGCQP